MTVLRRQYSPIYERLFTECSHDRSGIVRGVVSGPEPETSKMPPIGHGPKPRGLKRIRHINSCECGLPAYLTDLDESLMDYAFANFIAFINRENETERAETHFISAIMRTEFRNGF